MGPVFPLRGLTGPIIYGTITHTRAKCLARERAYARDAETLFKRTQNMANSLQLSEMRDKAMRAITRARGIVEKSEGVIAHAVQTVEVGGSAFAAGVIKGRYGSIEVMGLPMDLLAGAGGHVLGFLGGGKYAEHIHNFSDGMLASYLTTLGTGVGADWLRSHNAAAARQAAALPAGAAAGGLPQGQLTDAELAELARRGLQQQAA